MSHSPRRPGPLEAVLMSAPEQGACWIWQVAHLNSWKTRKRRVMAASCTPSGVCRYRCARVCSRHKAARRTWRTMGPRPWPAMLDCDWRSHHPTAQIIAVIHKRLRFLSRVLGDVPGGHPQGRCRPFRRQLLGGTTTANSSATPPAIATTPCRPRTMSGTVAYVCTPLPSSPSSSSPQPHTVPFPSIANSV